MSTKTFRPREAASEEKAHGFVFSTHHVAARILFVLQGATTVAASGGWLTPRQAFAKARNIVDLIRDQAKTPIKVHKLRGNVSILEGSGGNIAVLTGADGKVFIDAGITASRRILEAANGLSRDPIRHLINTHWHFDHTDGICLSLRESRIEDFNFPSSPLPTIPTETFWSEKP